MPSHIKAGWLDVSARAGVLLGAHASGTSYQPNLLSRSGRDQALIAGIASSTAYGFATTAHSMLRSVAERLPVAIGAPGGRIGTGLLVDVTTAAAGLGALIGLRPRPGEPAARSLARLAVASTTATAVAGVGANLLEIAAHRRGGRLLTGVVTLGTWAASYALTHPGRARAGSMAGDGGGAEEDVTRTVSLPTAAGMGPAVTLTMLGLATAESALSAALARAASTVLGGTQEDRRSAGRLLALSVFAGVGYAGLRWVNGKLTHAGEHLEQAHAHAPTAGEVTGGPGSVIAWTAQSRESRRWLSMALTPPTSRT